MEDVDRKTSHFFTELTNTWQSEVLPTLVVGIVGRLKVVTHAEPKAQMDSNLTTWELRTPRPLIQKTLQASLLPSQMTRVIKTQILQDPATVRDIGELIGKAVSTSVPASTEYIPLQESVHVNILHVASTVPLHTRAVKTRSQRTTRKYRGSKYSFPSNRSS